MNMHNDADNAKNLTLLDDYKELFASYQNCNPHIQPELAAYITSTSRKAIELHILWMEDHESQIPLNEFLEVLKTHENDAFLHLSITALLFYAHIHCRLEAKKESQQIIVQARELLESKQWFDIPLADTTSQNDQINTSIIEPPVHEVYP